MRAMAPIPRCLGSLAVLLSLAACASSGRRAVEPPRDPFRPIAGDETLLVWSAGIDACLPDPRDAGLRAALRHVEARILELPEELDDPDLPAQAVHLAAGALMGPMCLRVGTLEPAAPGRLPVWAQLAVQSPTAEAARARAEQFGAVLTEFEIPSLGVDEAFHGLRVVPIGPEVVHHGIARGADPRTLFVAFHGLRTEAPDLGTLDLPAGVEPALAFKCDARGLQRILATFGGEDVASLLSLVGLDRTVMQGGLAHGSDRTYGALRTLGWVPSARANGSLPGGSLPRAVFDRIPADATAAWVGRADMGWIPRMLRRIVQLDAAEIDLPEGTDPIEILATLTGFDLERDLLDALGESYGVYLADSTGGGGLYSAVAFLEVEDEELLSEALARMERMIEELADEDDEVPTIRVRHWIHGGARIATFALPGLPLPLELSYTVHDGWLVAAPSTQGIAAALDQAARPNRSLLDHPGFRAQAPGRLDDLVSLAFLDTPRFLRDGYPLTAMLGAALSQGLSSDAAPERVPPMLVPPLPALARDAQPCVALGRIAGEDLLVTWQSDRSMLVQMAGVLGAMGPLPSLLLAAILGEEEAEEEPMHDLEALEFELEEAMRSLGEVSGESGDAALDDAEGEPR